MPNIERHGTRDRPVHMVAWDRRSSCSCGASQNPDIDQWLHVLQNDFGIDDRATVLLRDLAGRNRAGFMHANAIIGKLMKKISDWVSIKSHSAWVQKCVKNAHRSIINNGA